MASERPEWSERLELEVENFLLRLRWVLAPAYVILGLCLFLLVGSTIVEFCRTVADLWHSITKTYVIAAQNPGEVNIINGVLTIVDLVLVSNLVLMVLLVGYVTFVSRIDLGASSDRLKWIENLDYTGLKLQVIGSIIAVSAIKLLRAFMELYSATSPPTPDRIYLMMAVHLTFLCTALIVAIVGKLKASTDHGGGGAAGGRPSH